METTELIKIPTTTIFTTTLLPTYYWNYCSDKYSDKEHEAICLHGSQHSSKVITKTALPGKSQTVSSSSYANTICASLFCKVMTMSKNKIVNFDKNSISRLKGLCMNVYLYGFPGERSRITE